MRTNIIIILVAILVVLGFAGSTAIYYDKYQSQKAQNELKDEHLKVLSTAFYELSNSFKALTKQKSYSISLAPNIDTKFNSTFGSSKNITMQYFFTMDGNKLEIQPDSVYEFARK